MRRSLLDALLAARSAKRPVAQITALGSGRQGLVYGDGELDGDEFPEAVIDGAKRALADDKSTTVEGEGGLHFVHVFNPPLRMVVVGAVHIAQPLSAMAALAGYDVTVVDPRRAFADDRRFPNMTVRTDWPDEALEALDLDRRTAVVTLTHDPKLDDPALQVALRSEAFYIGSLGSRKTHGKRLQRLAEAGFGAPECERIHGPVGLAIGAKSPAEIAISIMGQVTQCLHGDREMRAREPLTRSG